MATQSSLSDLKRAGYTELITDRGCRRWFSRGSAPKVSIVYLTTTDQTVEVSAEDIAADPGSYPLAVCKAATPERKRPEC